MIVSLCLFSTAGIMGGVYQTLSELDDNKEIFSFKKLIKNILLSLIASLLVPLFLSLADNNIIEKIETLKMYSAEFYKLLGFSLLASVYAKWFLDGISEKVFNKLENNEKATRENMENLKKLQLEKEELKQKFQKEIYKTSLDAKISKIEAYLSNTQDVMRIQKAYELIEEIFSSEDFFNLLDEKEYCALLNNKAYAAKRLYSVEEALKILEQAEIKCKNNIDILYNKACYLSILGKLERVTVIIQEISTRDDSILKDIEEDPDFENYRQSGEYTKIKENIVQ